MKKPISTLLRGSVAACLLSTATAQAEVDLSNMTDAQKDAFGAQIRAYLLENPEVIMEAVAVLEQRDAQAQALADDDLVKANLDILHNDGFSWVGGNPDGDITIVEFMDYRCGYCRRASPEVSKLLEDDGNIRLIVKEYPILGEGSLLSARFAIATKIVAGDDAYEQVHHALVALPGNPSDAALKRLAKTLGLDADAIMAEMDSEEITRRLRKTHELAQNMRISGTPSFVFGGRMVRGYAQLPIMKQIIAEEREKL